MLVLDALKPAYRNLKFWKLLREKTSISVADAETGLQSFLPSEMPKFSQKNMIDPKYDVMIIVPVYNVEKYLDQCIDSILGQKTNYTFQAVFVNDGATDGSGEILKLRITSPHMVINQDNRGVAAARNAALQHINGRYVLFLDSDDYLDQDTIEKLVSTADITGADIVESGHSYFSDGGEHSQFRHSLSPCQLDYRELYGFPWGKVIRSELLMDFCFPDGYIWEDTVMATLLHPRCRKVVALPDILYYYRDNSAGITHRSKTTKVAVDTFLRNVYAEDKR